MLKNTVLATTCVVLAILLAGCSSAAVSGSTPDARAREFVSEGTATAAPIAPDTSSTVDLTAAGAVCDPHSLDDISCLAAHPDLAVVNMLSGTRSAEPLRSMTDAQKRALARQACDVMNAGGSYETTVLVETVAPGPETPADLNNRAVFVVGADAYCLDHADAATRTAVLAKR